MTALNRKVKSSINQMMKEQRSLSVGSLPGNLKSHILKTIQYDHLAKPYRDMRSGSDVYAEGLNKINELTEDYEKVPAPVPESAII